MIFFIGETLIAYLLGMMVHLTYSDQITDRSFWWPLILVRNFPKYARQLYAEGREIWRNG